MSKFRDLVEQNLMELSKETLTSYKAKAEKDEAKHAAVVTPANHKLDPVYTAARRDQRDKRREGISVATKKLAEDGPFAQMVTELSKKTLGSYIKGATDDLSASEHMGGREEGKGNIEDSKRHFKVAQKRYDGIRKAADKIVAK